MKRRIRDLICVSILLIGTQQLGSAQTIKLAKVVSKRVMRTTELPGEFYPFLSTELHAKVAGYVDKVLVDRGSVVKQGELLVQLSAPELEARIAQAQAQLAATESDEAQAEAQLAASQSNFEKLKDAARTQGAVAENDLVQAKQQTDAAQALVRSRQRTVESMKANLKSQQDLAAYLRITAPFDGVITTR
ncbi:MAG: efflux RND transporter periplasmic adaptor subunit [Bryobacteraceae bacterium]